MKSSLDADSNRSISTSNRDALAKNSISEIFDIGVLYLNLGWLDLAMSK